MKLSEVCDQAGYAFYKCVNGNYYYFDWRMDKDGHGYTVYCIKAYGLSLRRYCPADNYDLNSLEKGKEYNEFFHVNEKGKINNISIDLNSKNFDSLGFLKDFMDGGNGSIENDLIGREGFIPL